MLQRLNENKDLIIVAIASFFIGFGAASFFGASSEGTSMPLSSGEEIAPFVPLPPLPPVPVNAPGGETNPADTKNKPAVSSAAVGTDMLQVENQRAGIVVVVQRAVLAQARWIVVREMQENKDMGNILGAGWFPAGVYEQVSVELLRGTTGGEEYYVVIFADEGMDKHFDHNTDKPLMNAAGNIIRSTFNTVANPGS